MRIAGWNIGIVAVAVLLSASSQGQSSNNTGWSGKDDVNATQGGSKTGSNKHGSYQTSAQTTENAGYSWSVDSKTGAQGEGHASATAGASASGEVHGQKGNAKNNVHWSVSGSASANANANANGGGGVDQNGKVTLPNASTTLDTPLSASGTVSVGVTVCGIPIDVTTTMSANGTINLGCGLKLQQDPKTGKFSLKFDKSGVVSGNALGQLEISVGGKKVSAANFLNALFSHKFLTTSSVVTDAVPSSGLPYISMLTQQLSGNGSTGNDWANGTTANENAGDEDPFDAPPTIQSSTGGGSGGGSGGGGSSTGDGSSSSNGGYNGIKAIKIFHY